MSMFMTPRLIALVMACATVLAVSPVHAGPLVVVTHSESAIGVLTREQVSRIFLGRLTLLPTGERVTVVEVESLRERFYQKLLGRNLAEVNAYWARLQFSGRTPPPLRLASNQDVLAAVLAERNVVTYVDADLLDPRAKVVFKLEP
jgi:hypothetical protein